MWTTMCDVCVRISSNAFIHMMNACRQTCIDPPWLQFTVKQVCWVCLGLVVKWFCHGGRRQWLIFNICTIWSLKIWLMFYIYVLCYYKYLKKRSWGSVPLIAPTVWPTLIGSKQRPAVSGRLLCYGVLIVIVLPRASADNDVIHYYYLYVSDLFFKYL